MTPFLKSVAEYLYTTYPGKLHKLAVVFPNKRARVFFNQYLSEIADKPVFAPKYYTITEYMQEISGQTVADQLTLLFALYEVYVSVTKSDESFDDFLFYCEMLLADFDDIDKYLVDAHLLFQNLSDLKEMDAYYEFLDEVQIKAIRQFWEAFSKSKPSPEKESFSGLWQVLYRIYCEFNQKLQEKELTSEGNAARKAILDLENTEREAPGEAIMFVGFNALNTCEKRLFSYLKNQGRAHFFWDYDDYYLKRKSFHEAAYFLGDLLQTFPAPPGFSFQSDLTSDERNIKIYDITTITGQAKLIPEILKELPLNWENQPEKTAIALADETLLMPVLGSIPAEINEVNISMGYPLKETSIYSMTGILLDLQKNKRTLKDGREQFYHHDVIRILQNGLMSSIQDNQVDLLINDIVKLNLVYVDSSRLSLSNKLLTEIFSPGIEAGNFVKYLVSILERIPQIIDIHGNQMHLIEGEATFRVVTQLRRIRDILSETSIDYSFKSLVRLVEKVLQGATVPFSGEPLSGLQIMGVLETRTLDFDNLILLSMNEGIFPKSGHVPSFIPYSLRKGFDLPTVEHQDAIFAYYFYRLLQRTKNVSLIYTSTVQDSKTGEPSRFIHQLNYEDAFKTTHQTIGYQVFPITRKNIRVDKTNKTKSILTEKYAENNDRLLSPSAINTYLNCNLRFYYNYISGLKEPENVLEEVEANTLGSILHKAMEHLYEKANKNTLTSEDIENIIKNPKNISLAVLDAFWSEYLSPGKPFPGTENVPITGKNILVIEVITKYIVSILNFDKQHAPIEIVGLENSYSHSFELKDGLRVTTGGIIDRLDRYNGKLRVIDYKTGRLKNSFKNLDELFYGESTKRNDAAFQTLLYSLVVSKNLNDSLLEPGLYFVRNMRDKHYKYQLQMGDYKKIPLTNAGLVLGEFEGLLVDTLNDIFSTEGQFRQTEDVKYCGYCPYNKLCAR